MGTLVVGAGCRAIGQGAIEPARALAVEPYRAGFGQAKISFCREGTFLWILFDGFAQVAGESSHRVITHKTRAGGKAGFIVAFGPYYCAFAEQLLGDLPYGPGGKIEQLLLGSIANIKSMALAIEIGFAADLG